MKNDTITDFFPNIYNIENDKDFFYKVRIILKRQEKSISTFDVSTLYTTTPHKLLIKVLSQVVYSSNLKTENSLNSLKHISVVLLRELEEDISLAKLVSIQCYAKLYW